MDSFFFGEATYNLYMFGFFSVYVGFDSPTKKNSISEVQNQLWHELEYLFIVRSPRQARSAVKNDKKRETDETCYVAKVTLHSIKYSPRSDHHLVEDKYM